MYVDELKYCPVCHDEYRPEIEKCATCDVLLIGGMQMREQNSTNGINSSQKQVISENDTLIPILRGGIRELKQVKGVLALQNIPVVLVSEGPCRNGSCGGPELLLQIRLQDQQRAETVLQKEHERTTGQHQQQAGVATIFDPEAEVADCPACGHRFRPDGSACPDCGLHFL